MLAVAWLGTKTSLARLSPSHAASRDGGVEVDVVHVRLPGATASQKDLQADDCDMANVVGADQRPVELNAEPADTDGRISDDSMDYRRTLQQMRRTDIALGRPQLDDVVVLFGTEEDDRRVELVWQDGVLLPWTQTV